MTLRLSILRVLWRKEWLRLRKQPMAILLLGLLTAVCVLIATSGPEMQRSAGASVPPCWIVYDAQIDANWMNSLREKSKTLEHPPIRISPASEMPHSGDAIVYPSGACGIEISQLKSGQLLVVFRHTGTQPDLMWPHSQWFWATTVEYFEAIPHLQILAQPMGNRSPQLASDLLKQTSLADLVNVELIGSMLIFGAQFFCCVHLLISFSSQDRERGTLLALALTPASVAEIIVAKCLFHGSLSLIMTGVIIGILKPAAFAAPLLWGTLVVSSLGFISVGILLSSLARTQSTAALLTLCYMLGVALIYHLANDLSAFKRLRQLMFEHTSFQLVYVGLKTGLGGAALSKLAGLAGVVTCWLVLATQVFARRGWR
ncbi:MAG: hypothetical protein JWM11_2421 [Planctomycetaceae bacterium]|nr:hypothetical protein [Planctomycetaceae bacterium]